MVNGSGGLKGKCCAIWKRRKNIRRVRELSGMKGCRERLGEQQNAVEELGGSDE